jgi:hypothetical protein
LTAGLREEGLRDRVDPEVARAPHVAEYQKALEAFAQDVRARKVNRDGQFDRARELRDLAVKANRLSHFKREIGTRYLASNESLRRLI